MNHAPLIGVTTSITIGNVPERAYVNSTYLHAIQQAGGVPIVLPTQLSAASLARLVRGLEGLLLTGGGDIDPVVFGEAPHPTLFEVAPAATRWSPRRSGSRSSGGSPSWRSAAASSSST